MPYIYHTDEERREMLDAIGLESEDQLFTITLAAHLLVRLQA